MSGKLSNQSSKLVIRNAKLSDVPAISSLSSRVYAGTGSTATGNLHRLVNARWCMGRHCWRRLVCAVVIFFNMDLSDIWRCDGSRRHFVRYQASCYCHCCFFCLPNWFPGFDDNVLRGMAVLEFIAIFVFVTRY